MGTASSAITTPELYFTWCMIKGVKVHLGYWLAQACHLMTTNTARHLYTCHLLGAYLQRNVTMTIAKSVPTLQVCDPPEEFNLDYFFNKGLLYMANGEVFFYEVGKTDAAVKTEGGGVVNAEKVEWQKEWQKKMGEVRSEMGEIRGGMGTLISTVTGLKGAMETHSEKMTEALNLMMRLVASVERRNSQSQQVIPPVPSKEPSLVAEGRPDVQRAPVNPAAIESRKRKESITNPTSTVPVRTETSKPSEMEEEEPTPSVPKKVQTNCPKQAFQKPGPQGSQGQN